MICVFVGNIEEDNGYITEVLQEKGYDLIEAGEFDRVEKTINPVIEAEADIAVYDLLTLTADDPEELVEIINSIQQSRNQAKIIFLAAGKGKNTPVIDALIKAGYVNFVLESTYGKKKELFARCLTNYYESNADRLDRELGNTDIPKTLHFVAFAGTQSRIGTTTQAMQYAGYLVDQGCRACYVEENNDEVPQLLLQSYQYAVHTKDCITYAGIPMYMKKTMAEMQKMNFEYFVLDMGDINREDFDGNLFLADGVKRVMVAGVKPNEWQQTKYVRNNAMCSDVSFIFSFSPTEDMEAVSSTFSNSILFAGYMPDMFARNQEDLAAGYRMLFPEKEYKDNSQKRKQKGRQKNKSQAERGTARRRL